MGRTIEMSWDCTACGHENLGRYMECQNCGDPKDAKEKYKMPGETSAAKSVTDPELLKLAKAGVNWECKYCGYHERKLSGECRRCGASGAEGTDAGLDGGRGTDVRRRQAQLEAVFSKASASGRASLWRRRRPLVIAGVGLLLLVAGLVYLALPKNVEASVVRGEWKHEVIVERYKAWSRSGFANELPAGAFDKVSQGQRHHHNEQVLDHYETETYTEQVACGEDCTTVPETCTEVCTPTGNGFATCSQSCSGGGQSCQTRYCSETRTREVPVYRDEPVYMAYYGYRIWDWGEERRLGRAGSGAKLEWPSDDEVALGRGLAEREKERQKRVGKYAVFFVSADDKKKPYRIELDDLSLYERLIAAPRQVLRVDFADHVRAVLGADGEPVWQAP